MSKIRIYELAKELGVDNKVVLDRARELGMDKSSHSNSLEPEEADQLRRQIIRQAIGASPRSEIVTARVNYATGEKQAVVERRSGNVIRRRKADSAPAAGERSEGEPHSEAATESEALPSAVEPPAESQLEAESAPEVSAEAVEVPEPAPVIEEPTHSAAAEEPPAAVQAAREPAQPKADEKAAIGPKILGKIELPRARTKPERPRGAVVATAAAEVSVKEGDESEDRQKRRSKKREISRIDLVDYEGGEPRRGGRGGKRGRKEDKQKGDHADVIKPTKASKRVVRFGETITVGELAKQMSLKAGEVIAKLMQLGMLATINQAIDKDTAALIAEEFEFQVESTTFDEGQILDGTPEQEGDDANVERSPVVTVMGHVDHGKTSLLDAIRDASVASREAGGITQHIGAYRVLLEDGRAITFLDTPGHEAFTAMRARGAGVTDIVLLVVAADEGAMPQTIEALNHAKAAEVPIIVVMNKMDRPGANPERLKQQLVEHGLQPEDWGGQTMYYPVSAQKRTGIKELLEGVLLQAEVLELKANPERRAKGTIIESRQDRGRGTVATVLVESGTLRRGDVFVCGAHSGRVRTMRDDRGVDLESAGPSWPVEITGLSGVPSAGDDFVVVEDEAKAREVASNRSLRAAARDVRVASGPMSLEEFALRANMAGAEQLNVVLKADVHGSVEAIRESLERLSTDKVKVRVLHAAVGGVTESDIQLASASKAVVVGFGVRAEPRAQAEAEIAGVDLRFYRIIYELIDDIKKAMSGLLAPLLKEKHLGRAEVRETFSVPKLGVVAGCFVVDGQLRRGARLRLLRDSKVIHEGKLGTLRRFKDDVREVQSGFECGLSIEGYNDIKTGDVLEVFEIEQIAQTI